MGGIPQQSLPMGHARSHRYKGQASSASPKQAHLAGGQDQVGALSRRQGSSQRADFDGVAKGRSRAVHGHIGNGLRRHPSSAQAEAHQCLRRGASL